MDYQTFKQLYTESYNYNDFDLYFSERGWQEWMEKYDSNGNASNIIKILQSIWKLKENPIKGLMEITGLTCQKLAAKYGMPQMTCNHWKLQDRPIPIYTACMLSYAVFSDEGII